MAFNQAAWENLLGKDLQGKDGKTLSTSDSLKGKDCIGLYFSAHWCPPCRGFTPKLAQLYKDLTGAGKNFEIIFVSSDKDEASFSDYYNEMPWLALPFSDRDRKGSLSKKFKVQGIPTLVLMNADGTVITAKGREAVSKPEKYPWIPPTFHEVMGLADNSDLSLINGKGESKAASEVLGNVDVIGLYFSAHWCPPCRGFTPQLAEKYKTLKEKGKSLEIVFVTADRDENSFKEYLGEMPWWSLTYDSTSKSDINSMFESNGIPHLVFVDRKTGSEITSNGRSAISTSTFVEDFPYYPKPVNDISDTADGINENLSLILFLDDADEATRKVALSAVNEIGEKSFEKNEDDRIVGRFFTVEQKCELGDRVRKMCKLEGGKAQMVLLDIPDNGGYYVSPETSITTETINAFVEGYTKKECSRKQLE